ncbi:hypothetical protein Tco_0087235 [Tanacetum coccineum]
MLGHVRSTIGMLGRVIHDLAVKFKSWGVSVKGLSCCLRSSSMRCLENVGSDMNKDMLYCWNYVLYDVLLTQRFPPRLTELRAPRVPVPFPEDPYEAIRQAYLVGMDTESEPFKDPIETETPESPHTVASPTSLPDSTPPTRHAEESEDYGTSGARSTPSDSTAPLSLDHPLTHTSPTLVPFLRRTTCMAMRVLTAMSPGLSASIAEVAAMSDSTFLEDDKEEDEDNDEEGDDEEEAEEIKDSLDSDSKSEDAEDKGPTTEDEDPATGDEGVATRARIGLWGVEMLRYSIGGGSDTRCIQGLEDGIAYIDVLAYPPPAPQCSNTRHLSSGLCFQPATAETKGFLTELGAQVEMQGGLIRDHTVRLGELLPTLFERYDRDIGSYFTSFKGSQTDAQRATLWHAISDTPEEYQEFAIKDPQKQVRHGTGWIWLEIFDSMRIGESLGDV